MSIVKLNLDSVIVDIIKIAIEIAIDRVSGSVNRSSIPVVREAVQTHLSDLRRAQVEFDVARTAKPV